MGFGRNPHVAKAKAAEQKAVDARDAAARVRAHRDAAHQWERAAERERPGKQRDEYAREAERNRSLAEGEGEGAPTSDVEGEADARELGAAESAPPVEYRLLN